MRLSVFAALVLGAALVVGGSSQAQAGGGFGVGFGYGGFGYGPGLGGIYGNTMVPGYPYYGNPGSLTGSLYRSNNKYNNSSRRTVAQSVQKTGDNKPIMILCPSDSGAALNYRLNDNDYAINPGESQLLTNDRKWVVTFDRGGEHGTAKYTMSPGTYSFRLTADHGWELYHDADMSRFAKSADGVAKNALPKK